MSRRSSAARAIVEPASIPSLFDPPSEQTEAELRRNALALHQENRASLLVALRSTARQVWAREQRPVSANDIRHVLAERGFTGDKRVLGQVFNDPSWTRVGSTLTACEGATIARVGQSRGAIGTYIPSEADV